jgi:prepilin-type processing-associated H-X9-DG protein
MDGMIKFLEAANSASPRLLFWLVNLSWQAALLMGIVWLGLRIFRFRAAPARFYLWLLALLGVALLPAISPSLPKLRPLWLLQSSAEAPEMEFVEYEPRPLGEVTYEPGDFESLPAEEPVEISPLEPVEIMSNRESPWSKMRGYWKLGLDAGWVLGVLFFLGRILRGHLAIRRLKRNAGEVQSAPVLEVAEQTADTIGLGRNFRLLASGDISQPVTAGIFRPAVILPGEFIERAKTDELKPILIHELAHIKRSDFLVNLFQRLLEAALFFHPLIWIASRNLRLAREEICDNWVLQITGERESYARSLARFAEAISERRLPATVALIHRKPQILRRIEMILDEKRKIATRLSKKAALLILVSFAFFLPLISACSLIGEAGEAPFALDQSSPEATWKSFQKAVREEDFEAAYQCVWPERGAKDAAFREWWIDYAKAHFSRQHMGELPPSQLSEVRIIDENRAIGKQRLPGGSEAGMSFTKVGDKWYLPASMEAGKRNTREKSQQTICRGKLEVIGFALRLYASDNAGLFPPPEVGLAALYPKYISYQGVFLCPSVPHKEDISPAEAIAAAYEYNNRRQFKISPKQKLSTNIPIVWDKKGNHPDGRNVLFVDGRAKWLTEEEFEGLMKKEGVEKPEGERTPEPAGAEKADVVKDARKPSGWKATLPNGVTVELVGASYNPSEKQPWWRPDGSPLAQAPSDAFEDRLLPDEKSRAYEFVTRVTGLSGKDTVPNWQFIPGPSTLASVRPHSEEGKPLDFTHWAAVFPKSQESFALRVGIAAGEWQTLAAMKGPGGSGARGLPGGVVSFSPPYLIGDELGVTISDNIISRQCRIMLVDVNGRAHKAKSYSADRVGGIRQATARFDKLPLEEVKEFRFQTRPYEWIEFRNISLRPQAAQSAVRGSPKPVAERAEKAEEEKSAAEASPGKPQAAVEKALEKAESPEDAAVKKKLQEKITFDFTDTPFGDVIDFVRAVADVNIVLDPQAVTKEMMLKPVTLKLEDVTVETALWHILRFLDLGLAVQDGVVFISDQEGLEAIKERKPKAEEPMSPEDAAVKRKLQEKITFDFTDAPFRDVMEFLRTEGDINIIIDSAVVTAKDMQFPITLWVKEISIESALEYILKQMGLKFVIKDGAVFVSDRLGVGVMVSEEPIVRIYIVWDLVAVIEDFEAPKLGILEPGEEKRPAPLTEEERKAERQKKADEAGERLAKLIRTIVEPEIWLLKRNSVTYRRGQLIVKAPASTHKEIEELLEKLRRERALQVECSIRVLRAAPQFLEEIEKELGLKLSPIAGVLDAPAEDIPPPSRIREDDLKALLGRIHKSDKAKIITAPRFTLFNEQRSYIAPVHEDDYIFDIKPVEGEPGKTEEVKKKVRTGLVFDVRPTISADRKYVLMDMYFGFVDIADFWEITTETGQTIKTPLLAVREIKTTLKVPDGETMVAGGLKYAPEEGTEEALTELLFLVTARIIIQQEEEERVLKKETADERR